MAPQQTTTIVFKDFVNDGAVPAATFVENNTESVDAGALKDGEVLVELLYSSVDPYLRPRMVNQKSYFKGFVPGQPLDSGGVGIVRASKSSGLKKGEVVQGMLPWSTHIVLGEAQQAGLNKIDPALLGKVPLSYFLGTLGMTGLTAFAGLKKIAEPMEGEVAFVSAAAGAVGLVAGQLLKHVYGCTVIGSAGSDDKVALLQQVGFDHAFNYKTTDTADALAKAAPDGLDIYFENVGGPVLEAVLNVARDHARIVACGMVSQYELPPSERYGIKNLFQIVGKRVKIQGMIVGDFMQDKELVADFQASMARYVTEGKVVVREHITEGIENAGRAFIEMMAGANQGKAVVKVAQEDPFPVREQAAAKK